VGNENGTRLRRIALLCTKSAVLSAVADRHDPVTRYLASGSGWTWTAPPSAACPCRLPAATACDRCSRSTARGHLNRRTQRRR